jgi:hypothetical protein
VNNVQTRARTTHADDHMETYTHRTHSTAKLRKWGKEARAKTRVKGYTGGYRCNFPEDGEIILFLFRQEKNLIGKENNFLNTFTNSPNVGVANQKRPSYYSDS